MLINYKDACNPLRIKDFATMQKNLRVKSGKIFQTGLGLMFAKIFFKKLYRIYALF